MVRGGGCLISLPNLRRRVVLPARKRVGKILKVKASSDMFKDKELRAAMRSLGAIYIGSNGKIQPYEINDLDEINCKIDLIINHLGMEFDIRPEPRLIKKRK